MVPYHKITLPGFEGVEYRTGLVMSLLHMELPGERHGYLRRRSCDQAYHYTEITSSICNHGQIGIAVSDLHRRWTRVKQLEVTVAEIEQ